jgi:hypothetical protein
MEISAAVFKLRGSTTQELLINGATNNSDVFIVAFLLILMAIITVVVTLIITLTYVNWPGLDCRMSYLRKRKND